MNQIVSAAEFLLQPLVGPTCTQALISLDLENLPCLKLFVSKALGLGIIGGSSILKVPQIVKIVQRASAQGISLASYLLETLAFLIVLAYNYRQENPFSTYGEGMMTLMQAHGRCIYYCAKCHYHPDALGV